MAVASDGRCKKYQRTGNRKDIECAWDNYYNVYNKINKVLGELAMLELEEVSPRLLGASFSSPPLPSSP